MTQLATSGNSETMSKDASISECQKYRYRLTRDWSDDPAVLFIMLNPSTADALVDDPTIRRCIAFARAWGFGGLMVGNLFAYRATDPKQLRMAGDPVGPENNAYLLAMARDAKAVVCAWGRHGTLFRRDERVTKLLKENGVTLNMLAKPDKTYPMHPLYLPKSLTYRPMP